MGRKYTSPFRCTGPLDPLCLMPSVMWLLSTGSVAGVEMFCQCRIHSIFWKHVKTKGMSNISLMIFIVIVEMRFLV